MMRPVCVGICGKDSSARTASAWSLMSLRACAAAAGLSARRDSAPVLNCSKISAMTFPLELVSACVASRILCIPAEAIRWSSSISSKWEPSGSRHKFRNSTFAPGCAVPGISKHACRFQPLIRPCAI